MDSELYGRYNNPETLDSIRTGRAEVKTTIEDIQRLLISLNKEIGQSYPQDVQHLFLQELRKSTTEFLSILSQTRQDMMDTCLQYVKYITKQYTVINPQMTIKKTKLFMSSSTYSLVLPHDTPEENAKVCSFYKEIVAEILFRREDMHFLLETVKVIDVLMPSLKVIEDRFSVDGYAKAYRDEEEEIDSGSESTLSNSSSSSSDEDDADGHMHDDDLDDEEDIVVVDQRLVKPSLARRIANLVFKSRYPRLDDSSLGYELNYRDNTEEPLIGPNFELFDPSSRNSNHQGRSSSGGRRRRRRRRCCTSGTRNHKCVLSNWRLEFMVGVGLVLFTLTLVIILIFEMISS
ncbi:hypothetical protein D0Z00_001805 [Geotrichum galactomycetum]|uniref:Uncharacterized protein n=1 Tax=Geotrichum galactomycetum TaxID=27317 RepID=A0ACB6V5X4_9ASCO|nr:hypothetical protein D0Z00_001805 [Geotrichum candidum]